ncbi:MAG: formylglycine-generating enzyme family protein [Desulfobacterales bacterium]
MTFVLVPGGSFDMGDLFDEGAEDEKPVHAVRIDAFYLAITPVTQAQWAHLMDSLPFKFKGHDRPVEQVSWPDVRDFIARINRRAPEGRHFDLPTEAQWEYAARSAGGVQRYAGSDEIDPVGWYAGNSGGSTRPVALKHPNGLGLCDMSGNVWEWCRDRFREDAYHLHGAVNPVITEDGADRVIRGGAWHLDAWSARCSRRFSYPETASGPALGFRLVMEAVQ